MKLRAPLMLMSGLLGFLVGAIVVTLLASTITVEAPEEEPAAAYVGPVTVPPGGECGDAP